MIGGSGGGHVREGDWIGGLALVGFYLCTEVFGMMGSPYSGFSSFLWD